MKTPVDSVNVYAHGRSALTFATDMKILLLLIVSLTMFGCDVVTTHYDTWEDVEFGKGWLPRFIPKSSENIITSNDLDVNTSEGEFTFNVSDFPEFTSKLIKVDDPTIPRNSKQVKAAELGYIPFEFSEDSSRWIFFIHPQTGHCKYWMYYIRK